MNLSHTFFLSFLLLSGTATSAPEEPAYRFVEIDLPDGWHRMQRDGVLSRITFCSPKELTEDRFEGNRTDLDIILSIQMDEMPLKVQDKSPREFADYYFLLKRQQYHDADIPLEMGEIEAKTIGDLEGYAVLFERGEGTRDWTFVGRRDIYNYVVNFTYDVEKHQTEQQEGYKAIDSIRLPVPVFDGPTKQYVTGGGDFAVTLPEAWFATRIAKGSNSTWYVTREKALGSEPEFDVGFEIMKMPDYSHHARREITGTDEKSRDGWVDAQLAFRKNSNTPSSIVSTDDATVDDIACRRVELSAAWTRSSAIHLVHVIGAKEDTVVHARFRCPEREWPYYRELFRQAEESLRFIVGRGAVAPWVPNETSGRYGDALLLADRLDPYVPEDFIPVRDPAPGSSAGWESEDSHQRLMLKVMKDVNAHDFIENWRDQLPDGIEAEEESLTHLNDSCSEAVFHVTRQDGTLLVMRMRAADAGQDRVFWLNATLDDVAEWRQALDPVFDALDRHHTTLQVDDDNRFKMRLEGVRLQLEAPDGFTPTFDQSRQVIGFESDDGCISLAVQVAEEERCHVWKNVETENAMESLTRTPEVEEKTNRRRPRAKDKRDRDRICFVKAGSREREWIREQTFHHDGLVCTLRVAFVAEDRKSAAAAARRSAPVFSSFKIIRDRR